MIPIFHINQLYRRKIIPTNFSYKLKPYAYQTRFRIIFGNPSLLVQINTTVVTGISEYNNGKILTVRFVSIKIPDYCQFNLLRNFSEDIYIYRQRSRESEEGDI